VAPASPLLRLVALAATSMPLLFGCASGIQSMGFGTGGTDCEFDSTGSSFPAGATVRMVATISPLPASVVIRTTKDGDPLDDPVTIELDGSVACVYGAMPELEAGHYEVEVTSPGSQLPPLRGSFDVTP
jgi:hypothetical protein